MAEGLAAEDHEVTERAEGAQVFRAAQFWGRSATIYLSYKKMQAKCDTVFCLAKYRTYGGGILYFSAERGFHHKLLFWSSGVLEFWSAVPLTESMLRGGFLCKG